MDIYNEDCITGAPKYIEDESIDLLICDPPFGINESQMHRHYNRNEENVLTGYQEAPNNYIKFTVDWMTEAHKAMKPNGSMYVFSSWNNLIKVLTVAELLELHQINHIIWKYNFGVFTKNKFVSSHYHILYFTKSKKAKPTFNRMCRF